MTALYTLTIFISAFLLFLIQPIASKFILPYLGGTAMVWNTAMMFFQGLLLAGYAYVHLGARYLNTRNQAMLHLILLALSAIFLPIAMKTELGFTIVDSPVAWIIISLLCSVGFPFFVLAANAPLLQLWLSRSDHPDAKNPYFLYSASNVGSLLALIAYPFALEPLLSLQEQSGLWSVVFAGFIALLAGCAWQLRMHYQTPIPGATSENHETKPTRKEMASWVALAFVPSSLMLGVTTYITTDIASLPLFWIMPLALYLITFILAFAREPRMVENGLNAQIWLVPAVLMLTVFGKPTVPLLALHLAAFFVVAMGCHGQLAARKPGTQYLTKYFFLISLGGMLGGVFNSLIAPVIFLQPVEYILVLLLALLLRPQDKNIKNSTAGIVYPLGLLLLLLGRPAIANLFPALKESQLFTSAVTVTFCLVVMLCAWATRRYPARLTLCAGIVLVTPLFWQNASGGGNQTLYAVRNFFGTSRVFDKKDENMRVLAHGTTMHGQQSLNAPDRLKPVSYYGILQNVAKVLPASLDNNPIAVVGLGVGTVACLNQRQKSLDIYEINPAVVSIAENPSYFTYLRDCGVDYRIITGDGRLKIAGADSKVYAMIIMDAFSSDAIPVHLLTREALAIYRDKLAGGGIIAFHITNRHLNLEPLMAALAENGNFIALSLKYNHSGASLESSSRWVALTLSHETADRLQQQEPLWKPLVNSTHQKVWTDNYSNILQALFTKQ